MGKWKESLFGKLFASILFVLFLTISVCGAVLAGYLAGNGYTPGGDLRESGRYAAKMNRDVSDIQAYILLKNTIEAQGTASYEAELRLQELELQLGVSSPNNLVWLVTDSQGTLRYSNLSNEESLPQLVGQSGVYHTSFFLETYDESGLPLSQTEEYSLTYGLRDGLPYPDEYAAIQDKYQALQGWYLPSLIAAIAAGLAAAGLFAFLAAAAGHRTGGETAVLNPVDRIWLEIPLALLVVVLFLWLQMLAFRDMVLLAILSVVSGCLLLAVTLTIIRRVKAGKLVETTLLHLIVRYAVLAVRHIHIIGRVVAAFILYLAVQVVLITMMAQGGAGALPAFIFVMGNLSVLVLLILVAVQYGRVKKGTEKMAQGELSTVVDEKEVPFFKEMAHNLNSSGHAIKIAVEQATQSERMKSELITNVSHDIKTPLTSIINYVGLLRTTGITDPKALEYVDILEHKSKRLAQLVADLVEASKVTSGAVGVSMESINLGELVKQAGGEFESRFEERGIQLMCRLPEQPVLVYADGRHMWRVLDNLFSNAVKYALDGTRIYVDLADLGNEAVLSMKNISRDPLNLHPDELMERFVRGDRARVGEGSGLGLSIARSLMELQNGTMDIQIDGDLFKVVLILRKM